ncbi:hypothetical protein T12_3181, partial [Trichinella patagoniensis]
LEREASPRHAATALEAKQQGRRTTDECSDVEHKEDRRRVHRDPGTVVTASTGSEEVDGMCRCPPGKPGESV